MLCCHRIFNTLHSAHADPNFPGNLANSAVASLQSSSDLCFYGSINRAPPQFRSLRSGPIKTGLHTLANDRTFQFCKDADHLEHRLSGRCRRVQPLLMQVEIDIQGVQVLQKSGQIVEGATEPINGPRRDHIEFTARRVLAQRIKSRSILTPLRAADAGIPVNMDDIPPRLSGDRAQFTFLVFSRLSAG